MKLVKYLIFVSILSSIFLIIYRQSDKKGSRRWFVSFKVAVFIAAILAGLISDKTEAAPPFFPGANGFTPKPIIGSKNPSSPKNDPSWYDRTVQDDILLKDSQIRRKFKHAQDFGITGGPTRENLERFKDEITNHMTDPSTKIINGTYFEEEAVHFLNQKTNLNVVIKNGSFLSCWKLTPQQLKCVNESGNLR